MKIRQHIPNFVDLDEYPEEIEFSTLNELLEIPFVKSKTKYDDFLKFSISDNHLMVEFDEGKTWYVVGSIDDVTNIDLPNWEPKGE